MFWSHLFSYINLLKCSFNIMIYHASGLMILLHVGQAYQSPQDTLKVDCTFFWHCSHWRFKVKANWLKIYAYLKKIFININIYMYNIYVWNDSEKWSIFQGQFSEVMLDNVNLPILFSCFMMIPSFSAVWEGLRKQGPSCLLKRTLLN